MEEQHLRMKEQHLRMEAETRAAEEAQRRQEVEVELERLRRQLANHQDNGI
jgi:chromosome condensin MukBEF ATPase and DNA-binding subunit MukB